MTTSPETHRYYRRQVSDLAAQYPVTVNAAIHTTHDRGLTSDDGEEFWMNVYLDVRTIQSCNRP